MRLVAEELACSRGGRPLFSGLGFAVSAGEALVITGRNGAGKSSLLRLVAGLLPAAAGRLRLEGGEIGRTIGEQAHLAGHSDAVKSSLTVRENLGFWRATLGPSWLPVEAALEHLAIAHLADLPTAILSAGQRRRLALARFFIARRTLWLLDEPTSSLDAATQARFAIEMRAHLDGGGIVVATTHGDLGLVPNAVLELGD